MKRLTKYLGIEVTIIENIERNRLILYGRVHSVMGNETGNGMYFRLKKNRRSWIKHGEGYKKSHELKKLQRKSLGGYKTMEFLCWTTSTHVLSRKKRYWVLSSDLFVIQFPRIQCNFERALFSYLMYKGNTFGPFVECVVK